jgi:hypothetical protein
MACCCHQSMPQGMHAWQQVGSLVLLAHRMAGRSSEISRAVFTYDTQEPSKRMPIPCDCLLSWCLYLLTTLQRVSTHCMSCCTQRLGAERLSDSKQDRFAVV